MNGTSWHGEPLVRKLGASALLAERYESAKLWRVSRLSTAVCSITPTKRRRFFWAAWWTVEPSYTPFRQPDASNGGARTHDEALREAERVTQRRLTLLEPHWARAWKSILRGETPRAPEEVTPRAARSPERHVAAAASAWSVLGLAPGASLDDVKRAFRKKALETHPDQGGDAEAFRGAQGAYEKLSARARGGGPKPRKR
jgi:hypothetical protein